MKKILVCVFVCIFLLLLVACNDNNSSESICDNCKEALSQNTKFCPNCGTAVDKSNNNSNNSTNIVKYDFTSVSNQFDSIKAILNTNSKEDVFSMFSNCSNLDNGNMVINGKFSTISGSYELQCWNNQVYQVAFTWGEKAKFDENDVVDNLNNQFGQPLSYNSFWNIYEWEYDGIEILFTVDEGVLFEVALDEGNPTPPVLSSASIKSDVYLSLSQEEIKLQIGNIEHLLSYSNKPKKVVASEYKNATDDDWNQMIMPGTWFGINGNVCFVYGEDGKIENIGFDWIPNNKDQHEEHMLYCLKAYFGNYTDSNTFRSGNTTYYQYKWLKTTTENWSVHLSLTKDTGWLEFTQLEETNNAPQDRPEADEYDEFIDVINRCFEYIPNCNLWFGDEDTGSSNSYALHSGNKIVGIVGIDVDSYDILALVDPDVTDAQTYYEQISVALIMAVDSSISYEDAKDLFNALNVGDSTMISTGIYGFYGIVSDMLAFGIDITWLN